MEPLEPPIPALPLGAGTLRAHRGEPVLAVPPHLLGAFAPATHCLYEWAEYVVEHPEADRLRVGGAWVEPLARGVFVVHFKNQLGLASLRLYAGTRPLHPPAWVEVLSPKLPAPEQHLAFYRTLLDDLFARAARLPFALSAETARGVRESLRPPSPLFTLHYLLQHGERLRAALSTVLGAPHRRLLDHPAWVPLADASEADADVLEGKLCEGSVPRTTDSSLRSEWQGV